MERPRYFDNAATTPLDPNVREAMLPYLDNAWANAHSIHSGGLEANGAVARAREQVAKLVGAEDPSQIFFTSGATESNNWVLKAAHRCFISPFEHSAMREPALIAGAEVIPNSGTNLLRETKLRPGEHAAHGPATIVSVMAVNNEIGARWDAREYAQPGDLVHSDATQAIGKTGFRIDGHDFVSASAHKFYGPKGIGFLYCRDQPPPPLILGGEQEGGFRGGTLNVAAIVGMGAAAAVAAERQEEDRAKAENLREILLSGLNGLADYRMNGGDRTSPFIVSVSFRGIEGETLVLELNRAGYAISAGAACSSRSTEPSHVLSALNLDLEWLRGTVRVSFGRFNTEVETETLAKMMRRAVEMLRTL